MKLRSTRSWRDPRVVAVGVFTWPLALLANAAFASSSPVIDLILSTAIVGGLLVVLVLGFEDWPENLKPLDHLPRRFALVGVALFLVWTLVRSL